MIRLEIQVLNKQELKNRYEITYNIYFFHRFCTTTFFSGTNKGNLNLNLEGCGFSNSSGR